MSGTKGVFFGAGDLEHSDQITRDVIEWLSPHVDAFMRPIALYKGEQIISNSKQFKELTDFVSFAKKERAKGNLVFLSNVRFTSSVPIIRDYTANNCSFECPLVKSIKYSEHNWVVQFYIVEKV